MIHRVSGSGSLDWFTNKKANAEPSVSSETSDYIHSENDSEECPTSDTRIKPTDFSVCANCERPIIKLAKSDFIEKDKEDNDSEEESDKSEEKSDKSESKDDKKEDKKPWEVVATSKKLEVTANIQDDNQGKNITRLNSIESNYGGSSFVAPGQFSMFSSLEEQISRIKTPEGAHLKQAASDKETARQASIKQDRDNMANGLKEQMASLFSQVQQSHSGSKEVLGGGTIGLGDSQISMFDGEGKLYNKDYQEQKTISKKAASERTKSIKAEKTDDDKSWESVNSSIKAKDKTEDLVSRLSKILGESFGIESN